MYHNIFVYDILKVTLMDFAILYPMINDQAAKTSFKHSTIAAQKQPFDIANALNESLNNDYTLRCANCPRSGVLHWIRWRGRPLLVSFHELEKATGKTSLLAMSILDNWEHDPEGSTCP